MNVKNYVSHAKRETESAHMKGCVYFSDRTKRTGPDWRYKIRTAGPDQISLLKVNAHSLAISDLRKFCHLNLINLQMDTDTRTGKFSSKEAVELATLQFNPFPCVYIPKAGQPAWRSFALVAKCFGIV